MEELLKLLESYHPVPAELQIYLLHHVPKEVHRANKTILSEGEVCDWIAFVEKGLVKIYCECEDMTERIVWFHKEGDVMGSMKSYYAGTPSKLAVRTMEETHLRKIRKTELDALLLKYPAFNINLRMITERFYNLSEDHLVLLTLPPKERYRKIQEDNPWILKDKRIKDYMVAGYLGIDSSTLCKYRKEG